MRISVEEYLPVFYQHKLFLICSIVSNIYNIYIYVIYIMLIINNTNVQKKCVFQFVDAKEKGGYLHLGTPEQ